MSFKHCPGIKSIIGPVQIITRSCASCGEEVEFFSDETELKCSNCGRMVHREASASCVIWCQYSEKCIDDLEKRGLIPPSRIDELKSLAKKKE